MECPCRWPVHCTLIFFLIQTANVYCQIEPVEEFSTRHQQKDSKRDVSYYLVPSPKTITENTYVTNTQDDRSRTLNVMSQSPSYYSQDPGVFSQSAVTNNIPNVLNPQCSISMPESSCNGVPIENYGNTVQPIPAGWHLSQPSNDVYGYPVNLKINSPSLSLPTQPGIIDFLSGTNGGALLQEAIMQQNGFEDSLPVNLQINIPSQNAPGPRITVVSAAPVPVTSANSDTVFPFPEFPPPIPIIMRKSRSSWKNLLPILLIALLNDQDYCCNSCCCCCDCYSDGPIPIPFPIPIPVNNPIINNDESSYSSRNRGCRDDEDDDGNN